ncbi:transposase [Candidatus Glomeribacter gigasporarum]|uniref:transposase n=1 Tax=Candidatus Glomeribacter gigasporarum TaxID=132144 RepID=UPI00131527E0|nr:transposase [Candidatus Glomeribacter gigasporarum]
MECVLAVTVSLWKAYCGLGAVDWVHRGKMACVTQSVWPLASGLCEVRAHPHAAGALQQGPQALGRSRNRLRPRTIDRHLYKARNLLERTFNWIKLRRVATRFETLDLYYAAIVSISCMCKRLA